MSAPVIAIGGIGGSGTRACAQVLLNAGYHLGADLNDALDNLTFTLMFKRHSALMWNHTTFESYLSAFLSHLRTGRLPDGIAQELADIPAAGRAGHSADWLAGRLARARASVSMPHGKPLGWKEPNTHIFIERILEITKELKYVHIIRDYKYMTSSKNNNQIKNWSSILLDLDGAYEGASILRYWFAVQERMIGIYKRFPDRVMFLSYDRLSETPQEQIGALLRFCETPTAGELSELTTGLDFVPATRPTADISLDAKQSAVLAETLAICA